MNVNQLFFVFFKSYSNLLKIRTSLSPLSCQRSSLAATCTTSRWTFFFRLFLFVHMWWNAGEPHCDHRQHWQKVFLDGLGQEPHSSTKGLTSPPSWPFSFSFRSSSLSSLSSPILDHNNHQEILYIVQHRACATSFRGSRSSRSFSSFFIIIITITPLIILTKIITFIIFHNTECVRHPPEDEGGQLRHRLRRDPQGGRHPHHRHHRHNLPDDLDLILLLSHSFKQEQGYH